MNERAFPVADLEDLAVLRLAIVVVSLLIFHILGYKAW